MTQAALAELVSGALEELKARDIRVLDVSGMTSIMDTMVVASGTSDRHVRALADKVVQAAKAAGVAPLGLEGETQGEWVLVDLGDLVLHIMMPQIRDLYQLEKLWDSQRFGGAGVAGDLR
ncbi:MAG: ribosome silencing factor [Pseudomonadota bacterium]